MGAHPDVAVQRSYVHVPVLPLSCTIKRKRRPRVFHRSQVRASWRRLAREPHCTTRASGKKATEICSSLLLEPLQQASTTTTRRCMVSTSPTQKSRRAPKLLGTPARQPPERRTGSRSLARSRAHVFFTCSHQPVLSSRHRLLHGGQVTCLCMQ